MVDKVKPLKIENPANGGDELDMLPREADPAEDHLAAKGIAFENTDTHLIYKDGTSVKHTGNIISLEGTLNQANNTFKTNARQLGTETQATANSTKTLTSASAEVQIFTGTTAGQRLRLPNATTLQVGHVYEVWNFSSQQVFIDNNDAVQLTNINANGRTQIILRDNSTSNGVWGLTYTLDNGNSFGTQLYYADAIAETSTTSLVTYSTKLTLTTPANLPLGDYLLKFQFNWRSSAANREADFRFQLNGGTISEWRPSTARTQDRQLLSGFVRSTGLSGVNTYTFQFKVGGTATTIFTSDAKMIVWRIA